MRIRRAIGFAAVVAIGCMAFNLGVVCGQTVAGWLFRIYGAPGPLFAGMGAIVLDGAVIGRGAIVAAGALVPPGMVVPPETMVVGVPAKNIGKIDDAKKQLAQRGVDNYVHHKEAYRNGEY